MDQLNVPIYMQDAGAFKRRLKRRFEEKEGGEA